MGWEFGKVGHYGLLMHSNIYHWATTPRNLESIESKLVALELTHPKHEGENIFIPLTRLGTVVKVNKRYRVDLNFNLSQILMELLAERGIPLVGTATAKLQGLAKVEYYLQNELMAETVQLSSAPKTYFRLTKYEELYWLRQNGLDFSQN